MKRISLLIVVLLLGCILMGCEKRSEIHITKDNYANYLDIEFMPDCNSPIDTNVLRLKVTPKTGKYKRIELKQNWEITLDYLQVRYASKTYAFEGVKLSKSSSSNNHQLIMYRYLDSGNVLNNKSIKSYQFSKFNGDIYVYE